MKPMTIILFGIVGSGKGTQADLLIKHLANVDASVPSLYVYPGNEFRTFIKGEEYTNKLAYEIGHTGKLQPDFLTIYLFGKMLVEGLHKADTHVFFDGYPRTILQAQALETAIKFYNRENPKIIYIKLGKEEAVKRMKLRNRHDDTDEGIQNRFAEYENNVIPAMNYFKDKPGYEMIEIDGEQTVEKVQEDILKSLGL